MPQKIWQCSFCVFRDPDRTVVEDHERTDHIIAIGVAHVQGNKTVGATLWSQPQVPDSFLFTLELGGEGRKRTHAFIVPQKDLRELLAKTSPVLGATLINTKPVYGHGFCCLIY